MDDAPQFVDMDFAALVNGIQASIIQVDHLGRISTEPISFLKDKKIKQFTMDTQDNIVTLDMDSVINDDEIDLKFYDHKILAKTFRLQNTLQVVWMVLPSKNNILLVGTRTRNGDSPVIQFDLSTGARKELYLGAKGPEERGYRVIDLKPLWDLSEGNFLVHVADNKEDFWARLNPNDMSLATLTPIERNPGAIIIDNLLEYDRAGKSVICHGVVGEPPLYSYHGTYGFYEVSLETGKSKLIMSDDEIRPYLSMSPGTNIAIINRRYVIMTGARDSGRGPIPNTDPHTFLIDLQMHHAKMLDIPYVTWPISQEGLHVQAPAASSEQSPSTGSTNSPQASSGQATAAA